MDVETNIRFTTSELKSSGMTDVKHKLGDEKKVRRYCSNKSKINTVKSLKSNDVFYLKADKSNSILKIIS